MYPLTPIERIVSDITGVFLSSILFFPHINDYNLGVSIILYLAGTYIIQTALKMMIFWIKNNTGGGDWQ
jgi:hypothetical protein